MPNTWVPCSKLITVKLKIYTLHSFQMQNLRGSMLPLQRALIFPKGSQNFFPLPTERNTRVSTKPFWGGMVIPEQTGKLEFPGWQWVCRNNWIIPPPALSNMHPVPRGSLPSYLLEQTDRQTARAAVTAGTTSRGTGYKPVFLQQME